MGATYDVGSIAATMRLKTGPWDKGVGKVKQDAKGVEKSLSAMTLKVSAFGKKIGLVSGAMATALVLTARSFVRAASTSEQYRVRLVALLGSVEEGNRLFQEMTTFAGAVPFEFEQIMGSATQLSGVMKGGVDQVAGWMPMIADLAAVSGMSIEDTTGQIVRMYSAGAASADMFRERGILAMLGFQAGMSYTAEETRKQLIAAWTDPASQFRDAAQDLATTWTGTMSMLSDKWFWFRNQVMQSGLFEAIKDKFASLNNIFAANQDALGKWIQEHGQFIVSVTAGVAALATMGLAIGAISVMLPGLAVAYAVFASGALAAGLVAAAPWVAVVAGVGAALGAVYVFRALFKEQWDSMMLGIATLTDAVLGGVSDLFTKMIDNWKGNITDFTAMVTRAVAFWMELSQSFSLIKANQAADAVDVEDLFGGFKKGAANAKDVVVDLYSDAVTGLKVASLMTKEQIKSDIADVAAFAKDKLGIGEGAALDIATPTVPDVATMIGTPGAGGTGGTGGTGGAALDRLAKQGDSLFRSLHPAVDLLETARENLEALNAAGHIDDETRHLLGVQLWEQFRDIAPAALSETLEGMQALEQGGQAVADAMHAEGFRNFWLTLEDMSVSQDRVTQNAEEQTNVFGTLGSELVSVGSDLARVGDLVGSTWGRSISAATSAFGGMIDGLDRATSAAKSFGEAGQRSTKDTVSGIFSLVGGLGSAVGAVGALGNAFGLFGDDAEKEMSAMDEMMNELENAIGQWADQLTDAFIDFIKTGEVNMKEFVNGVLEDLLRITIRYAVLGPLMGGFAQGGVFQGGNVTPFARGGVISSPTLFPLAKGAGLMGEAGPEAVVPLKRTKSGDLGVQVSGAGGVVVNVNDHRKQGADIDVQHSMLANGQESIEVTVRDIVDQGFAAGEFDQGMQTNFQRMARRPQ